MADVIKSDIEKIERALNIRLDDVEIEAALNSAYPQIFSTILENEPSGIHSNCYQFMENLNYTSDDINDTSALLKFARALNLSYQRHLLQLSKNCQSISISAKSNQSKCEVVPMQAFEYQTEFGSKAHHITNNETIQAVRRMMQREEKARLSSNETIEKLINCVAKSIRRDKENDLSRQLEVLQVSSRDENLIQDKAKIIQQAIDNLQNLSNRELIRQVLENVFIDWSHIMEIMNNQYTEKCFRQAWQQICVPMINSDQSWSLDEDKLLKSLVEINGSYADQWEIIALNFPHRSAYMCASRYMLLENNCLDKIKFSKAEINQLKQMIAENRHDNYIPLNKIAYKFGRSPTAVRREWRQIDPDVRRGQWQVDEDEKLLQSVLKQSNRAAINWNIVASDVPGRSLTKCYHRYIHLTRQNQDEPLDDQLLIEQHQLKNARWSEIQPYFPGRSCYTLQNRWKKLLSYRQINQLFCSQQSNVQLFILKHFPMKTTSNSKVNDSLYRPPSFQLTYDQLISLTSNNLFIQFCNEISQNEMFTSMGIRQFLNKLSKCHDIQQIKQFLLSVKKCTPKSR